MSMDVLVVGGGGREHALSWALRRSASVGKLFCTPGNAGITGIAECLDLAADDLQTLTSTAASLSIDLVVVGPEAPLADGLADLLEDRGIPCFGPSRRAALIEGSKVFAKTFMQRHGIPTAAFEVFETAENALAFVDAPSWEYPLVVKADGLAAGKGVVICEEPEQARRAVTQAMVHGAFGSAGRRVVVEKCLRGVEITLMALCDGDVALPLVPSQDHKAVYDDDRGPNTGGMGAFAPADSVIDGPTATLVNERILQCVLRGLEQEDRRFRGLLYVGLMLTEDGPSVLEFNCRFGDPETQVVLPLLDEDLAIRLAAVAADESLGEPLRWSGDSCACITMAAPGYPGTYPKGAVIEGLDRIENKDNVLVFHAGTRREGNQIVSAGGRVLGICGLGDDLPGALESAYSAVEQVHFEGMHYRRDIGRRRAIRQAG